MKDKGEKRWPLTYCSFFSVVKPNYFSPFFFSPLINDGRSVICWTHCGVIQIHPWRPRAVVLHEGPDET